MGKGKTKIHLENQGANRSNMNWCTHPRSGRVRYQTITINKTLYAPFPEADSISDLRLEAVLNIVSLDYIIRNYSWRHNVVMHGTCSVVLWMWNRWQKEAEEDPPILCGHCPKGKNKMLRIAYHSDIAIIFTQMQQEDGRIGRLWHILSALGMVTPQGWRLWQFCGRFWQIMGHIKWHKTYKVSLKKILQ